MAELILLHTSFRTIAAAAAWTAQQQQKELFVCSACRTSSISTVPVKDDRCQCGGGKALASMDKIARAWASLAGNEACSTRGNGEGIKKEPTST